MIKRNLSDLLSSIAVARGGTFTRTATRLDVTRSAPSQSIGDLEARLQIRSLTHTTYSISPTTAGECLLNAAGNRFDEIEAEPDELSALRDKPSDMVHITCGDHIQRILLLFRLTPPLLEYPDIEAEFGINYVLRDIVTNRFDAGVHLGNTIDKGMITVPIGPPIRIAAVAAPAYLAAHPRPRSPRDLVNHNCINMRTQSGDGLYTWDFQRKDRHVNIHVDGQLTFSTSPNIVDVALAGLGIAWFPEEELTSHIEKGRLLRVLENRYPPFPGYYLCYPNRQQLPPAFSLVVGVLRYTRPRGTTP